MDRLQSVIESSSYAIFILDQDETITHINSQAKERFGLISSDSNYHPAGKIEPGDIVILVDNSIGGDDGALTVKDLETHLGVKDRKVQPGSTIIVVGKYDTPGSKPIYKSLPTTNDALELKEEYEGVDIEAKVGRGNMSIDVGGTCYVMSYFIDIHQIVVLDGKTHKVKFWQEKGFTARKEGAGDLLRGGEYREKTVNYETEVIGHRFKEFFNGEAFETCVENVLSGKSPKYVDADCEINGFALVASIIPFHKDDKVDGVVVKFRRIEDIKATIIERNKVIKLAERKYYDARHTAFMENRISAGGNTQLNYTNRYAFKLSQLDCDVLITGESGTGKTRMARAIYSSQPRKGPFVMVDCSAVAPTLFESEMFGYVAGAFTGADPKGKIGFFEEANGGTIFLDEISEIPLTIQAKLLSVIQNKTICRVGSTKVIPIDVRIIAATNRDIKKEMERGNFRSDLYYRISAFTLSMPSLRDCKEDIFFIVDDLMTEIRQKYNMPEKYLSGEAFSKLMNYHWPGNIRELENVLENAVALSDNEIIYPEYIRIENNEPNLTLKDRLKLEEKKIIQDTITELGGDKEKAMKRLGLSRSTFYEKLKGLDK